MVDEKVGRVEFKRHGKTEVVRTNVMENISPGQTITNKNPGGGGYGNAFERPIEKVVWDVKNGLVSIEGARRDYGVVLNAALHVDDAATRELRAGASS
jgi:N-methylhydantoinase B